MFASCNLLLLLFTVPQAAGQGFLQEPKSSEDAKSVAKSTDALETRSDAANLNAVSSDAEGVDAGASDDAGAADEISDTETLKDLKDEAQDLKDASGDSDAKEDGDQSQTVDADELEQKVEKLEGVLDERAAKKGNESAALLQNDDDGEDEYETNFEAEDDGHESDDVTSDASLLQDVTRLSNEITRRRDDQVKDNTYLQDMVHHLIDEARAAKAQKQADPEVIMVLLQTLKKHRAILGLNTTKKVDDVDEAMEEGSDMDEEAADESSDASEEDSSEDDLSFGEDEEDVESSDEVDNSAEDDADTSDEVESDADDESEDVAEDAMSDDVDSEAEDVSDDGADSDADADSGEDASDTDGDEAALEE